MTLNLYLLLFFHLLSFVVFAQSASEIVYLTSNGCLEYVADEENNVIPDYSYAGYRYGEEAPPNIPVVMTISPVAGDNTNHIQSAIDEISRMPLNSNGIRGALLLNAGVYTVEETIQINNSGVVLRGVGQGANASSNTIIKNISNAPFSSRLDVVVVGNEAASNSWDNQISGTSSNIVSPYLPAGAKTLEIENINRYNVGDDIIVFHPSTNEWLASIDYGGTAGDDPWIAGEIDLKYARKIVAINEAENKIVLDVPIYDHFDRALSQASIYKYNKTPIRSNIGIENLRIDIQTSGENDETHAYNAVRFVGVEDAWARQVTALHFSFSGFVVTTGNKVSVLECSAIEPHSSLAGSRRYNFNVLSNSNNILFQNCFGNKGRHIYTSNGASKAAGIVFHNSEGDNSLLASEGHRKWSQALLYDNVNFPNADALIRGVVLGLYNRGDYGTGHGWSVAHSTAWNVDIAPADTQGYTIQKPPKRQNYGIGNKGKSITNWVFRQPTGHIELHNQTPSMRSLYETQLNFRRNNPQLPDAPAQLTAKQNAVNEIVLNWLDIASNEVGYRIDFRENEAENFQSIATVNTNTTTYTHAINVPITEQIEYRVSAIGNSTCISPYSNKARILKGNVDTFVRNGNFANDNYGNDKVLAVKVSTSGFTRESFIRASLENINAQTLISATLKLKVAENDNSADNTIHELRFVENNTWNEKAVTYNNKPSYSSVIDTQTVPNVGQFVSYDITNKIIEQLNNGEDFLSVSVVNANQSPDTFISYHSFEADDKNDRPELVIIEDTLGNTEFVFDDSKVLVYPNPFIDKITFKATKTINCIFIYDALGRLIHNLCPETKSSEIKWEIENSLSSNLLFYKVEMSDGSTASGKVIKR